MVVAEPTFCNLSSSIGRCTPESRKLLICISHVLGLWKRRSACEARSSSQSLESKEPPRSRICSFVGRGKHEAMRKCLESRLSRSCNVWTKGVQRWLRLESDSGQLGPQNDDWRAV